MSDAIPTNPLSDIYQAMMDGLKSFTHLTAVVRVGNFIDISEPAGQVKQRISRAPADFPQVYLSQSTFDGSPYGKNAKMVAFTQRYLLRTASDTVTITQLNEVKWLVIAALTKLGPKLGLEYVAGWKPSGGTDRFGALATSAGKSPDGSTTSRWHDILAIDVFGAVDRRALLAAFA